MIRFDTPRVPVTVNLHITAACNYECGFCYATFPGIKSARGPDAWIELIHVLAAAPPIYGRYKIDKLTFAGGEPTLVPYLPTLLQATREAGLVVSVVTNGTGLTEAFLDQAAANIDWLALSVDSPNELTNQKLGRGSGQHLATTWGALERLRRYPHIQIKLNTVITSLNWREDFHGLIRQVGPARWKVFQATAIADQNGAKIAEYEVSSIQFDSFCERHADLNPVCETADQIKGSYLMIDPQLRFFGNSRGYHVYSDPILGVGVEAALGQIDWSPTAFIARGGSYDWRPGPGQVQP